MELKITADWVLHRLSESSYIDNDAYWITTSDTIYAQNSNFFWIIKALGDLGVEYLKDEYSETILATGIEYQHFCFGISFNDMERLKDKLPETYHSYFNLRYSTEIQRKKKINKIINH
jgi:hypothetical protein